MPRLLIISPHFPPVNAPDMQRVRMSLPHFADAGWEIVVLTVDDPEPMAPLEPALLETLPRPVRIVRTSLFSRRWTRWIGVNNLGLRALLSFYTTGTRLMTEQRFDLVYFSTTQFVLCPLGRIWRRRFGVPYVIDLQDPWLNEYYRQPSAPRPPGGWKYSFAYASAKILEAWTLRKCAHVISVSSGYLDVLQRRYPWFSPTRGSVVTFGAPDADFALVRQRAPHVPRLLPPTATLKIAYAGRLGGDMRPALEVLFAAVARLGDDATALEFFFFGTSYARAGQGEATTTALAARHGLATRVHESPTRIGYLDALQLLTETDIALLLGSEDRAYSPSKIYPTLLAARPTLALAPRDSVLETRLREIGGASLITFDPQRPDEAVARLVTTLRTLVHRGADPAAAPLDGDLLQRSYTAAAVSAQQLRIFNDVLRESEPAAAPFDVKDYWPDFSRDAS
jgi:hypothetical protein